MTVLMSSPFDIGGAEITLEFIGITPMVARLRKAMAAMRELRRVR